MIQELFGGGAASGLISRERNISISGVLEASPSPTISPSSSNNTTTTTAAHAASSENQNLRCPRCDSSNTKFCYYNNYNLTQPRHFCKTCRRYWTKGGALRNVPIGGGCRKNKATTVATPVGKPISTGKLLKTVVSSEIGRSSFLSGFEHELNSNPILWPAPPESSHILALLRSATDQNPNPNPNFLNVKDEGSFMIGSNVMNNNINSSDSSIAGNLGFDPLGQIPSVGLCSSFWRNNNQNQAQQIHHDPNGGTYTPGIILNGEVHNSRNPYQRLRSSQANYSYHPEHTPVILGNVGSTPSTLSSTILDSAPVNTGGEFGFWNPSLSWSDLPTTNGAYP